MLSALSVLFISYLILLSLYIYIYLDVCVSFCLITMCGWTCHTMLFARRTEDLSGGILTLFSLLHITISAFFFRILFTWRTCLIADLPMTWLLKSSLKLSDEKIQYSWSIWSTTLKRPQINFIDKSGEQHFSLIKYPSILYFLRHRSHPILKQERCL